MWASVLGELVTGQTPSVWAFLVTILWGHPQEPKLTILLCLFHEGGCSNYFLTQYSSFDFRLPRPPSQPVCVFVSECWPLKPVYQECIINALKMIQFIDTESKCIYTYLFLERQEDFNKQVMLYINGRFVSKNNK